MSYVKNTWQTGDTITATGLNHMEDGIADAGGGGAFVIDTTYNPQVDVEALDKTWAEIKTAFDGGKIIIFRGSVNDEDGYAGYDRYFKQIYHELPSGDSAECWGVSVFDPVTPLSDPIIYETDSENGYPLRNDDKHK